MAGRSILDSESRLSQAMGTAWQLICLNFLVIICSLPVVTIGPAFTAMHHVLLKLVRKEESYLAKEYFRSFRQNLGQAVLLWLIKLAFIIPLGMQLMLLTDMQELPVISVLFSRHPARVLPIWLPELRQRILIRFLFWR